MLHIPILRQGCRYESVDRAPLVHHATGRPIAEMSLANSGLITRDVSRADDRVLEGMPVRELIGIARAAAEKFMQASLPLDGGEGPAQSFDDYVAALSATTGMPVAYCRRNAEKIHRVLDDLELVLAGLTRGFPLEILDRGYGDNRGHMLCFFRAGRTFGAVLPSNSPGVHSLWIPAFALKAPIFLKPGREEPWTPLRVIAALIAAGAPRAAFGFYPTDHAGAGALLHSVDRGMVFGDANTMRPYQNDPRIELHGPGYSKILLGDDAADDWERHLDLMVESIAGNAGRSCINASGIWTPRNGRAIADALAERLARVAALPVDDPQAQVAAFARPQVARAISGMIDGGLRDGGAVDLTSERRGGPRLVERDGVAFLLPTIVWIEGAEDGRGGPDGEPEGVTPAGAPASAAERAVEGPGGAEQTAWANGIADGAPGRPAGAEPAWEHPLANREFLLPFASVVECPQERMPEAIGPSLIVSAITGDREFSSRLMATGHIDRLNIGPIPTNRISWDQPHEGNLFELLYRQRAFQVEGAA